MADDRNILPTDDALDLSDPIVRDFVEQNAHLSTDECLRQLRATIDASEKANFLCPKDRVSELGTDRISSMDLDRDLVQQRIPRQLGTYTLEKEIGRGGFSRVFQAICSATSRRVAVKVFDHRMLDAIERLEIERLVLQKLNHPNLLSVIEVGQSDDGVAYLVMPLIHGVRIDQYAERENLSHTEIARLFARVAAGLQYAHERGIIHRDLKPGNILVSDEGVPIVTDFGLAKHSFTALDESQSLPSVTATGAILGTLGYLAPEQMVPGHNEITRAADIYGLGASLFRVLVGQPPSESRNLLKALRESRSQRASFPSDKRREIPSALRAICLRCLEKSPADRYSSMTDIQEDLGFFAEGKAVRVRRIPWAMRMKRWMQAEPVTSALSLSLITVILSALVVTFSFWRMAERERLQVKEMLVTAREILNEGDLVAERSLASVPGTLEFRLQRLEKSSDFFDRLLARYPNDPALINDSGVSNFRLATVAHHLGRNPFASEKLSKAETQFQRLTDAHPESADHRFDLFHCLLMRSYIYASQSESVDIQAIEKADRIISGLVKEYPDNSQYLDAQICVRLKLVDHKNILHKDRIEEIYRSAVALKRKKSLACLEWRHAGTAARKMVLYYLEHFDRQKADQWLSIAKTETLEFLERPDGLFEEKVDWIECLEGASKVAYLSGDNALGDEMRQQWKHEIREWSATMPGFAAFQGVIEQEPIIFDGWLAKARTRMHESQHRDGPKGP